jgi:hypothetical protein
MPRPFAIFLAGAVLGTLLGVQLGFFVFPYLFSQPVVERQVFVERPVAVEPRTNAVGAEGTSGVASQAAVVKARVIAQGAFIQANPAFPMHWGKGSVAVRTDGLHLGEDFEVGPGPKFHVYLVPRAQVRTSNELRQQMFVDLGPLRAFKGGQRYDIPGGLDLAKFQTVVIWSEQFSVLISPADLNVAVR